VSAPFKPNLSVKEGLDHLATRLDSIIAARLKSDLGDHPWTVVLEILDQKKGYANGYKYWTYDLQAQLRMLTERLGDLGFPFDDQHRTVSTLGNELRIVRKQMAHMHTFSTEEAFRSNDFSVRLLEHFGDEAGLDEARRVRHEALAALAAEEGVTELAASTRADSDSDADHDPGERTGEDRRSEEDGSELVSPGADVLQLDPSLIGDQRLAFDPWTVVRVGSVQTLDDLPKKAAKEMVRAVAVEIGTYEAPIHLNRLVQLTAQSFGLQRVRSSRHRKLAYHVQQSGLFVDDQRFLWPRELDPRTWTGFRPNDSTADRPFQHISPVEIANAARFIQSRHPSISTVDLESAVLQTFGRKRRTTQVASHLAKALRATGAPHRK